jgi:hypothetical protein
VLNEILRDFLPTKISRVIVAISLPLVPFSIFLHESLKSIGVDDVEQLARTEVRLLLGSSVLCLLLLSLSINLLNHINKTKIKNRETKSNKGNLGKFIKTGKTNNLDQMILETILQLRGMNEVASPKRIAELMNNDMGVVHAHLNKLHNDQYVTFITGGKQPTHETDFFLNPKAIESIKLQNSPNIAEDE